MPDDAPLWMKNTKLCLYWSADGDAEEQCGEGVENTLCAGVGEWTEEYRDDTDGRAGGCQMSWGFQLP